MTYKLVVHFLLTRNWFMSFDWYFNDKTYDQDFGSPVKMTVGLNRTQFIYWDTKNIEWMGKDENDQTEERCYGFEQINL